MSTRRCLGENGRVKQLEVLEVDWLNSNGKMQMVEKSDTVRIIGADLVLLAMGFVHCVHEGIALDFNLDFDPRGNIMFDRSFQT
jgi:glutamate synthase (NADPH/NADH) small chain